MRLCKKKVKRILKKELFVQKVKFWTLLLGKNNKIYIFCIENVPT